MSFSLTAIGRSRSTGGYVLDGGRRSSRTRPIADLLIVFARTSEGIGPFGISAFLLEAGTPGL